MVTIKTTIHIKDDTATDDEALEECYSMIYSKNLGTDWEKESFIEMHSEPYILDNTWEYLGYSYSKVLYLKSPKYINLELVIKPTCVVLVITHTSHNSMDCILDSVIDTWNKSNSILFTSMYVHCKTYIKPGITLYYEDVSFDDDRSYIAYRFNSNAPISISKSIGSKFEIYQHGDEIPDHLIGFMFYETHPWFKLPEIDERTYIEALEIFSERLNLLG